MECYICHKVIQRHEYTRHVGSHLAGNNTGMYLQPDPSFTLLDYNTVPYDYHGTVFPAHSTAPSSQSRTSSRQERHVRPAMPDDELQSSDPENVYSQPTPSIRQGLPDQSPDQLNAFQMWQRNPTRYSPKYTTIDGQDNTPDSRVQLRQSAEILRSTTREEVIKIVKDFEGFSNRASDRDACLELVQNVPIFPGLVAYTYTHLVLCLRGWLFKDDWSSKVSELETLVKSRTKSGDVQCVLMCSSMKNTLLEILRATKVPHGGHKCNLALLNGTMMLSHDILNLAAVVALCITGPQEADILDQRGTQVEGLVNLFHDLLEATVELEDEYQRRFVNPLIKFSKEFGCCPRGIYLKEDTISELAPQSQGGFGLVYKGKLGSRLVAVKVLKQDSRSLPEYNMQVSKEAIVWRHLRHPNCLPLYGVYTMPIEGPNIRFALVSPWMDRGTLSEYLERNPQANRTLLISDIVRGLAYLHSLQPHVAHRDLKPDNILITNKGRACLADFGLVSTFDTDDRFHTAPSQLVMAGTYNYMAPEIFEARDEAAKRKVNKRACDMYSLGCTIYVVYMGKLFAFHRMCRRPEFPNDKITPDMWSFVENLCSPKPLERLTAEMALAWMETKASQEGVDVSPAPLEEEWEWKGPRDDNSLWSVSV